MPESSESAVNATPVVSIILPTYNRARFLPGAISSIRAQEFTGWELIIVDDGSTDDTEHVIGEVIHEITQPIHFIRQENQGPYGARNTGLDRACGKYIAFYDSDDLWLPHHLHNCVQALEANPGVDWVYGACRLVNLETGMIVSENSFYLNGKPRPFMAARSRQSGNLQIIDDSKAVECQILHGFFCGLQNSVLRRSVFEDYRFEAISRNEAEDQLIVIEFLLRGRKLGYLNHVHVEYRIHDGNSSCAGNAAAERLIRVTRIMAEGFERLLNRPSLPAPVRRALRFHLSELYFWHLGYAAYWKQGQRSAALPPFRRGILYWPWQWRYWKTYAACTVRVMLGNQKMR